MYGRYLPQAEIGGEEWQLRVSRALSRSAACLSMQIAVIEFARNVLGLKVNPVVVYMPKLDQMKENGSSNALGLRATYIQSDTEWSQVRHMYKDSDDRNRGSGELIIHERHRHRYGTNPDYVKDLNAMGFALWARAKEATVWD
ncbi:unnamed protein product [Clonostachys byssicola]|uniref:Uncharacterized protein n=1 Tax=Clonostachys byssicola TaxID=160290 RepID=A0A9N9UBQ4_9HYPO|nr:unnamed protein product [Clonostachys byssicola]